MHSSVEMIHWNRGGTAEMIFHVGEASWGTNVLEEGSRQKIMINHSPATFSLWLVALQSIFPRCTCARVLGLSLPFSSTHQHRPAVTLHCSARNAPSFVLHSGMNTPRSHCLLYAEEMKNNNTMWTGVKFVSGVVNCKKVRQKITKQWQSEN